MAQSGEPPAAGEFARKRSRVTPNSSMRAISDPHDGVAQAALYRPPFFALNVADVVAERDADAKELISRIRRERFARPAAATALRLLDDTAFGRATALAANGQQKLDAVRNLVSKMDVLAQAEGLDFDAVTERLHKWVENPVQMDPPAPIDRAAVQILTIHQAKGLEFPVVAIWDGFEGISNSKRTEPWLVSRDHREWSVCLDSFRASSLGSTLAQREAIWKNEERLRLYYVAATRARDLLVIPEPRQVGKLLSPDGYICARLLDAVEAPLVEAHDVNQLAGVDPVCEFSEPFPDEAFDASAMDQRRAWETAREQTAKPRCVPIAVTTVARTHRGAAAAYDDAGPARGAAYRFGPAFGSAVHRVLARVVSGASAPIEELVRRAAAVENLTEHLDEAVADVRRAINALNAEGLLGEDVVRTAEYPLLFRESDERLLVGSADLLAKGPRTTWLIDFKTDAPGSVEDYPAYAEQIRLYACALAEAGVALPAQIRAGLLFTADGVIRWAELNAAPPRTSMRSSS